MVNPYDYYITPEEYDLAAKNGVDRENLNRRIRLLGWEKSKAINTPLRRLTDRRKWVEIAAKNGVGYSTFMNRVNNLGWSEERAATAPLQDRRDAAAKAAEKIRKFPREYVELAEKNGIPYQTFRARVLKYGYSLYDASTKPIISKSEGGSRGSAALRRREGDWAALIFGCGRG